MHSGHIICEIARALFTPIQAMNLDRRARRWSAGSKSLDKVRRFHRLPVFVLQDEPCTGQVQEQSANQTSRRHTHTHTHTHTLPIFNRWGLWLVVRVWHRPQSPNITNLQPFRSMASGRCLTPSPVPWTSAIAFQLPIRQRNYCILRELRLHTQRRATSVSRSYV